MNHNAGVIAFSLRSVAATVKAQADLISRCILTKASKDDASWITRLAALQDTLREVAVRLGELAEELDP